MANVLTVKGQLSGKEYLQTKIDYVVTIETGQVAQSVENTRHYYMKVRVSNTYKNNVQQDPNNWDDKWSYYDISVRIIPRTAGIQLFTGANFQTATPRRDFGIDRLVEQDISWTAVYFKWTKPQPKDVNELEFDFGMYAQEVQRVKNWTVLKP